MMPDSDLKKIVGLIENAVGTSLGDVEQATALDQLPMDSLDLFTVIGELEEATSRKMSDEDMEGIKTLGDIKKFFFGD
ncbi:MAG: acyl carrier protein [Rhizobiales bacterium]|nr:acyl carrier protein [Hyphomicrobiales bacterium]MBO6698962.1 acyl carrier protein [Hyphomicrobiales bacterium]MBO6734785.1 acyl carrier protein [Hyphomicrobiales bacterium]MBO6911409.1 acyl carrier protein [Hyphomicrobiales bacterium]MBO6955458.1 acyl carrier protein [Hyphomicrobiales bacterium]